jgi:restriction system protein
MAQEHTVWCIKAGRNGEAEPLYDRHNVAALGWKEVGDLSDLRTREDFKSRYARTYPNEKTGAIRVNAGQLFRFIHEMKVGDAILLRRSRTREISLGWVDGEYEYNTKLDPDFPHIRRVRWLKNEPRTRFSQGALYEVGAIMAFFQVRNYADEFLTALEGKKIEPPTEEEEDEVIISIADDIEQQSHDFVLKQLSAKLKGHGLAEFVGHLLTLMGYKVKISPPGPDRGIDIVAHKDDLGVEPPTVLVQVKSSDSEINEAAVSELYGKVSERDFGLVVAVGGFNRRARDFGFSKRNLKLIDGDELVELIYKYYDRLDGKYKGMIPLRRVFIPESLANRSD